MINLVIEKNLKNKKQIIYAFYYLTQLFNMKVQVSFKPVLDCINIYYGVMPEETGNVYIPAEMMESGLLLNNMEGYKFLTYKKIEVPPYRLVNGNIEYSFDILSVSFYLLSCSEEYEICKRDDMNRFLSEFSYRSENIRTPFFDINSSMLMESLKLLDSSIELKSKPFEILLTHDVDNLNSRNIYVFLHNCKELLFNKNKKFGYKLKDLVLDIVFNRHLQIENFITLEKKYDAKSEFYFIEGIKHRLGKRYELCDVSKEISDLKKEGFPIGLHTNYFSYDNEELIKSEINAIEQFTGIKVYSGRNHYVRFSIPSSWKILNRAGILCDSTLGYSDKNGFRAGTTKGFIPYDLNSDELIPIYEVPLAIMDGVIMDQNISFEEKWKENKAILDEIIKHGGTASVLWHEYLIYNDDYRNMYDKILDYISSNGGRFILNYDVTDRIQKEKCEIESLYNSLA